VLTITGDIGKLVSMSTAAVMTHSYLNGRGRNGIRGWGRRREGG